MQGLLYTNRNTNMKIEEKIQRKEFKRERGKLKEDLGHAKKMNQVDIETEVWVVNTIATGKKRTKDFGDERIQANSTVMQYITFEKKTDQKVQSRYINFSMNSWN